MRNYFRMYTLVLYSLSPIQKGIQAGHAWIEYARKYQNNSDYQEWADQDKTVIVLDGGTSNYSQEYTGMMQLALKQLQEMNIAHAVFNEPDINDALTAICFLVPERIYAEYEMNLESKLNSDDEFKFRRFLKQFNLAR